MIFPEKQNMFHKKIKQVICHKHTNRSCSKSNTNRTCSTSIKADYVSQAYKEIIFYKHIKG